MKLYTLYWYCLDLKVAKKISEFLSTNYFEKKFNNNKIILSKFLQKRGENEGFLFSSDQSI